MPASEVARLESELAADPALAVRILRELPSVRAPERVLIRCDAASVDAAIARALALAVDGIESRIELERD